MLPMSGQLYQSKGILCLVTSNSSTHKTSPILGSQSTVLGQINYALHPL